MLVGNYVCDVCGNDCTALWGFLLATITTIRDRRQAEILEKIRKEFGKAEFAVCWSCTAKAFGVKTLAEKEAEKERATLEQQKPDLAGPSENFARGRGRPRKSEQLNGQNTTGFNERNIKNGDE